jgi:hypothetical protein
MSEDWPDDHDDESGDERRRPTRAVERFLEERATVPGRAWEIGELAFELFEVDEIAEAQIGYAIGPDDDDLTGDAEGQWRPLWLVVGEELWSGETLIVDLEDDGSAVLLVTEDEDGWGEPLEIAGSLGALAALLGELAAAHADKADVAHLVDIALARTPDAAHAHWRAWLEGGAV